MPTLEENPVSPDADEDDDDDDMPGLEDGDADGLSPESKQSRSEKKARKVRATFRREPRSRRVSRVTFLFSRFFS